MSNTADQLFGGFSPATKYEAMLLEKGGPGPTEEKTVLIFRILDELIPNLGVYCQLVKILRDNLFDAVYSEQYTGSADNDDTSTDGYIQRVPFFTLVKRVYTSQDERAESLTHQLETVKEMLFEKHKKFEDSQETVYDLENEITRHKDNISRLEKDVEDQNNKMTQLEATLDEERSQAAQTENNLTCDIRDLEEDLTDTQNEVSYLQQFKQGFDDLQNAFVEQPGMADIGQRKRKAVVSNKKSNVIASVETSMKLEQQILQVQNSVIEEFDHFLEEHKKSLNDKQALDNTDVQLYEQQEMEIDQEDQQLMLMQEKFRKTIDQIAIELDLLRQHKVMLEEQIQIMEENKPATRKQKKHRKPERPGTQESLLSTGLDEDEEEDQSSMDPFNANERVFSKYAAMMYTSSDGQTYHEFKDAKYCPSCGEKTVFCPHKIGNKDKVFVMPPSVSHVKIVRPKVRINKEILEQVVESPRLSPSKQTLHSRSAITIQRRDAAVDRTVGAASAMSKITDISSVAGDSQFPHTVQRLWEDYMERTSIERSAPRPLSLERCISVIEQFSASLFWQDDYATEEDGYHSILDLLYRFMSERYMTPEILYLSAHDLLTAISEYSNINKTILLFAFVLIGNLDAAVFRYLLLMNDFIDLVDWQEVDDFQAFAAVIYPFLHEDDLETMQMGYTSFSENKVSKQLVSEYIIYCIMKYREPRFLECENKLLNTPGKEVERMTEREFVDSSDNVLPVVNEKLRRRLYRESEAYVAQKDLQQGAVPILRLAQITGYMALLQLAPMIRNTLSEKVITARDKETVTSKTVSTRSSIVTNQDQLLTMYKAKNLAYNISRRTKCRKSRRHHGRILED